MLRGVAVVVGQLGAWRNVLARIDAHAMVPVHQEDLGIAVGVGAACQAQPCVTLLQTVPEVSPFR